MLLTRRMTRLHTVQSASERPLHSGNGRCLLSLNAVCDGARSQLSPQTSSTTTQLPTMISRLPEPLTIVQELPTAPQSICSEASYPGTPLGRLRSAMKNVSYTQSNAFFDAFLVFHSDEHLSEEPAPEERRLQYISGWDGAGTAAVLADGGAALFVASGDVRRARATVSCAWLVVDENDPSQPTITEWIAERPGRNGRVGADARLTSVMEWQSLFSNLQREGMQLVHAQTLIDQLWADEPSPGLRRPEFSRIVANLHNLEYTGMTWRDKVAAVRAELRELGADAMVVTSLDEVAWLLNVRGRDVPYAPLLKAFVVVSMKEVRVYAPPGKLSMPVREALAVYNCYATANNCTRIHGFEALHIPVLHDIKTTRPTRRSVGIHAIATAALGPSPCMNFSSRLAAPNTWPPRRGPIGPQGRPTTGHLCSRVNDYTTIYADLRRASETKILIPTGDTFQRGASAAIAQSVPQSKRLFQSSPIIYFKAQKNDAEIRGMRRAHLRDAVAMCTVLSYIESMGNGEHLRGPTTELGDRSACRATANTVPWPRHGNLRGPTTELGDRSACQAALSTLQAPGTLPAAHADPVARGPLWTAAQDYPSPTGHGVGAALNRREDPVVIDYRQDTNLHTFREGYFVTSEPAWYESRKFGVKLGNVLLVVAKPDGYLGFREATLLPFEPKLIDRNLLTEYEINWLNAYNERIRKTVGPDLTDQGLTDVYYWMMNKTIYIEPPSKARKSANAAQTRYRGDSYGLFYSVVLANVICYIANNV
ncbi:unnamed protein product, partial [Iphiclides podalirius]